MTSASQSVTLAAEFPTATRDQWRTLVAAVLAKSGVADADPEQALSSLTYDGIRLQPLYTATDVGPAGADFAQWQPGVAPFVRGSRPVSGRGWDVRQRHAGSDAEAVNRAILLDLENGVTSIWLTVGTGGISVQELPRALAGVYLDLAPIALDAGVDGPAAARAFLQLVAETRAVTADEIAGTLGLDPIGVRARTGAPADLAPLLELAEQSRAYPKLTPITVDAVAYHEAGGNDSQELAVAAAVAVAYVRALTDAGWSAAEAFGAIEFRYAVTADQFLSIAKLRAARRIWNRIGELCGVDAAARGQRQHAVTSPAMLTRRDPWVNMLRATVACFAAAAGGAESITVAPFDSAIGLSDDFARRIARNTQSILHDESSLARVADPAGGSWYVESITDQLAHAAWDVFTAIERAGGALAALDSGYIPGLLDETRWRRNDAVAHRRDPITGVSEFALITETAVSRPAYSAAPEGALLPQIRYAEEFELLRDRADAVLAASGERPVVFLACLGPVAAHTGRAGFAANLFQAGGFEPVIGTGDASELAAAFTASAATVACLCSSDKLYTDLAGPVASALKAAGANKIWLAGKPGERADSDAGSGIDGYIFAGCNAIDVLTATFDGLGVH